jgi:hypothetical protein
MDGGNANAGSWTAVTSGTQMTPLNNRSYFEQSGASSSNVFEAEWVAPAAGTGEVSFYGSALACNGNGTASGDSFAPFTSLTVQEDVASGVSGLQTVTMTVYPNPAQQFMVLESQEQVETVKVYNMAGAEVITYYSLGKKDISNFEKGIYVLEITLANGEVAFERMIKQ